ncbi:hypothetical protein [Alkalicoccus chagannorensis]|uniref:hypothetical protein n=1 Tax=Alkalicoccus chagannorensis TaxID=427072 RepID=UPI00040F5009|nr:hypothetical protein [Alkalicoccus chagannorensis]
MSKFDEHEYFKGTRTEIDEETGEIRVSAPQKTHVVRSKKQIESYKKKLQKGNGRQPEFTFSNMESIKVLTEIKDNYLGHFLYIQTYIDYNNRLVTNKRPSLPMRKADIKEYLGVGERMYQSFMSEMKKHNLIFEQDGYYYVNDNYHFRGKTNNSTVIRSFKTKIREMYGGTSARDVGMVYKLLPYVHLKTNTICKNPYEEDVRKTQAFNQMELSRLVGMKDQARLRNKMMRLKIGDEYVFGEIKTGHGTFYRINPAIFYRKRGNPPEALIEEFSIRNNFTKKK